LFHPMTMLIAALLAASCSCAQAETTSGDQITVIDGDTVAIGSEHIRLLDIDAPVTWRWQCEDELAVGTLAKERLAELLQGQQVEVTRSGKLDRYGRTLGRLRTPQGDAGAILLHEGLALTYSAGAKAKAAPLAYWCSGRPADQ
jgi:micrococcal nuclease